jgi:type II secretory pathway pseudopilin PulG
MMRLNPNRRRKLPFTLLEVAIVLMIVGFIAAVTGVQIKKMLDRHHFETEVSLLFTRLQEAQLLSAAYQTDLAVDLYVKGGKPMYCISTAEPFCKETLNQEVVPLLYTKEIKFKNNKAKKLHFDIYAGGRIEPGGILAFNQAGSQEKTLWFDLQRSHLMKLSHRLPKGVKEITLSSPKPA